MSDDDDDPISGTHSLSQTLESLRKSTQNLTANLLSLTLPIDSLKSFLDLEPTATHILSHYPYLKPLSRQISLLKTLITSLKSSQDDDSYSYSYSLFSFLRCRILQFRIGTVAAEIEAEVKGWLDRERVERLVRVLRGGREDEEEMVRVLEGFRRRVCKGFDAGLQDLVLKFRVFGLVESIVCDGSCGECVREKAAMLIAALVRFNRDVFLGMVLMGSSSGALVSMGTRGSLRVLCGLIELMRGHLVDEMDSNGDTVRIIGFLGSEDVSVREAAMDCLFGMVYHGRCEVVEMMIECGLIEKLVFLQRQEGGGGGEYCEGGEEEAEEELEDMLFVGCVARFALQVEMGTGMESDEKKGIKLEILRRAREASVSEAEAATMVADLLWGSFS